MTMRQQAHSERITEFDSAGYVMTHTHIVYRVLDISLEVHHWYLARNRMQPII